MATVKPIEEQNTDIFSTKLPKVVLAAINAFAEANGTTGYELAQIIGFRLAEYAKYKMGVSKELSERTAEVIDSFGLDHDVHDALLSYRRLTGMQSVRRNDGDIRYLITVHDGGVVTVYDPQDNEEYFTGSITISLDKALAILLSKDGKLPEALTNVMADRGLISVYKTIMDVLNDENRLLGQLDDKMLGYAQNEYGNVPKKTHTIKPQE